MNAIPRRFAGMTAAGAIVLGGIVLAPSAALGDSGEKTDLVRDLALTDLEIVVPGVDHARGQDRGDGQPSAAPGSWRLVEGMIENVGTTVESDPSVWFFASSGHHAVDPPQGSTVVPELAPGDTYEFSFEFQIDPRVEPQEGIFADAAVELGGSTSGDPEAYDASPEDNGAITSYDVSAPYETPETPEPAPESPGQPAPEDEDPNPKPQPKPEEEKPEDVAPEEKPEQPAPEDEQPVLVRDLGLAAFEVDVPGVDDEHGKDRGDGQPYAGPGSWRVMTGVVENFGESTESGADVWLFAASGHHDAPAAQETIVVPELAPGEAFDFRYAFQVDPRVDPQEGLFAEAVLSPSYATNEDGESEDANLSNNSAETTYDVVQDEVPEGEEPDETPEQPREDVPEDEVPDEDDESTLDVPAFDRPVTSLQTGLAEGETVTVRGVAPIDLAPFAAQITDEVRDAAAEVDEGDEMFGWIPYVEDHHSPVRAAAWVTAHDALSAQVARGMTTTDDGLVLTVDADGIVYFVGEEFEVELPFTGTEGVHDEAPSWRTAEIAFTDAFAELSTANRLQVYTGVGGAGGEYVDGFEWIEHDAFTHFASRYDVGVQRSGHGYGDWWGVGPTLSASASHVTLPEDEKPEQPRIVVDTGGVVPGHGGSEGMNLPVTAAAGGLLLLVGIAAAARFRRETRA